MKLGSKIYNTYYRLGRCYILALSCFSFKNRKIFISNFSNLFKRKAEIMAILKKGPRFWVRSFDDLAIIRQIFDEEVYKLLFSNLKKRATLLDIGAYIGDSAIYASLFPKVKKVIAVEPLPDNLKFLRKNLRENKITNVIVIDKAASSDTKGRNVYLFQDKTIVSLINSPNSSGRIFVKTITLSDLGKLVKTKLLLLKCDIEGGEYELFLKTPIKILSRINRFIIEMHLSNLKDENLPNELISYLEKAGFTCKIKKSFFNPKYPLLFGYRL